MAKMTTFLSDPEDYPDPEDLERQFAKSVGPFVYVPMTLPREEPPTVLTEVPRAVQA